MGTFSGARRYVLHTFAKTQSALMKKRVSQYLVSTDCPECDGKRLRREALSVTFAGRDIAEMSALPLKELAAVFRPYANGTAKGWSKLDRSIRKRRWSTQRIAQDLEARLSVLLDLGLGYLALDRSTPTLSPGELQRLRLATQVRSNLFGVVYVLDEPSAGLHPADTEALLRALDKLKASGNSLFVVEHELDVIRHADWIVDVGPAAGQHGGQILYSGRPAGLAEIELRDAPLPVRRADGGAADTAHAAGMAATERHHAQQPARPRRRLSAVRADHGDGCFWLGQVEPGQPGARRTGRRASRARGRQPGRRPRGSRTLRTGARWRTHHRRHGAHPAAGARRSETDRPDAAVESRHLHRPFRSRPQTVRRDEGGEGAAVTTPADSRSTSPKGDARTAKAKAS